MKKPHFKLKKRTKIKIIGLNQERIINDVSKNYYLYNINRIEKNLTELEVENKDYQKVKGLFCAAGLKVEHVYSKGFLPFFVISIKSYGVIFAIMLSILVYIFQFQNIWQIKVFGNEKVESSQIISFVGQNFSLNKSKIDEKAIENALKEQFFDISSISVAIVGQSLIINIYEKNIPEELQGQFLPICSNFDGRITKLNLIQGTLAVKVNQIVQKGDVLVYPYIIDSQGEKRDIKAEAEIYADVWILGEAMHSESFYQTSRTGQAFEVNKILIFGMPIYSSQAEVPFADFQLESKTIALSKNNILPLLLQKDVYYQTETTLVEKPFEEVKADKIEEAKQKALTYLLDYDIIKNEDIIVNCNAGIYYIKYLITVNRMIGEQDGDIV